ncbi:hypothetical protein ABZU32_09550 [Sphaerisporangium sp. NPDC005288]|uniref:hypothetical protein n=1 Tax=Sphaerisporangium sp. NPDC005288 TaxID=3155114 RepID=UPI0033A37A24
MRELGAGPVLVGADGGNSVVRRHLVPEVGLANADLCGAMGRTPLTDRFPAPAGYREDLLERGNAAVEVGKQAQKRFVPAADEVTR